MVGLQHHGGGVDLAVQLCQSCESDPIAPLAGSAILS
jgi:hypothetical protein